MPPRTQTKSWLLLFLVIPLLVAFFPQFYTFEQPTLIGIPFFYWFQMLCVVIIALFTAALYRVRG